MLNEEEKRFVEYWEANRLNEKKVVKQLLIGLPIGAIFGLPIIFMLFSGRFWYKRADTQAINHLNPLVLIVAVFLIVIFVAIFYKRHQWEMKEQQYLEMKFRQQKDETKD